VGRWSTTATPADGWSSTPGMRHPLVRLPADKRLGQATSRSKSLGATQGLDSAPPMAETLCITEEFRTGSPHDVLHITSCSRLVRTTHLISGCTNSAGGEGCDMSTFEASLPRAGHEAQPRPRHEGVALRRKCYPRNIAPHIWRQLGRRCVAIGAGPGRSVSTHPVVWWQLVCMQHVHGGFSDGFIVAHGAGIARVEAGGVVTECCLGWWSAHAAHVRSVVRA